MPKFIEKFTTQYLSLIILELCKYVKISFALASGGIFFSLTQVLMPVIGLYKNKQFNAIIYAVRTLFRIFILGFNPLILFYYLPTFCGNAYLANKSTITKIAIPLICMIMFIVHPIGSQAFIYSMYWLIPIAIAFFKPNSIFLQALGSTFTVQAVGSVVWLYTKKIDPSMWIMLIPFVIIERLILASLTTIAFYIVKYIENMNISKSYTSEVLKNVNQCKFDLNFKN